MSSAEINRNPSKKEQALLKALYDQIFYVIGTQKVGPNAIAYANNISSRTILNMKKSKDITLHNVVKLIDSLGYDLKLIKQIGVPHVKDNPELMQKIKIYNERLRDYKRTKRGLPTGELPVKIRVKQPKRSEDIKNIISRRSLLEQTKAKDDFFKSS